ncbi:MAG: M20/M25/M40 family metallo-hydrolase [Candidatus Acidiferrales bacterium]
MQPEETPGARRVLPTIAILAVIFFLSVAGLRPPAPLPSSVAATEFSAERAREVLRRLVGDGIPHPTGSAANAVVRSRIVDELTKLGYQPEVQSGFSCDDFGTCATVKNILARLDGVEPGASVLLAAHYDSVPAGPGASDDGAGVAAVIEIARALKSAPAPRHSIVILIDDGEEQGLLGAHAFVTQSPWAKDIRAAVNLEARGTSGPSMMFETGSANYWAVKLYSEHVARPAASSIFYQVYKQLPNDTDFTEFKAVGYQGANFAYIGDVNHYHTPLDNFENADPRSLQHHGENALPMILALANSDLTSPPVKEAVFFDLFERRVIMWPAGWSFPISIVALVLLLFQIAWLLAKDRLLPSALLWGFVNWLAIFVTAGVLALIFQKILHVAGVTPTNWVAHPLPLQAAFWCLAISVVTVVSLAFENRSGFWGLWAGVWIWWALFSAVVCWLTGGIGYVLLVPTCIAAVVGLPFTLRTSEPKDGVWLAAALPLFAAGILGFNHVILLYDGLGIRILAGIALLIAVLLSPLAPLLASLREPKGITRFALPGAAIAATVLAVFAAVVAPAYSAKAPEHVNLQYRQDGDSGKSQWVVYTDSGRLPEPIRVATNFHRIDKGSLPWDTSPAFLADAPHLEIAAPTFTILESSESGGKRQYRALLRSERGAPEAAVFFPPDSGIDQVRIQDEPIPHKSARILRYFNDWDLYRCMTMPAKGIEMQFELPLGKPVEVYVLDLSYLLPLEGMFVVKSRPLTATPFQQGDVTILTRRVQLNP